MIGVVYNLYLDMLKYFLVVKYVSLIRNISMKFSIYVRIILAISSAQRTAAC